MRFRMPRSPRMLGILWAMNALRLAKGAKAAEAINRASLQDDGLG